MAIAVSAARGRSLTPVVTIRCINCKLCDSTSVFLNTLYIPDPGHEDKVSVELRFKSNERGTVLGFDDLVLSELLKKSEITKAEISLKPFLSQRGLRAILNSVASGIASALAQHSTVTLRYSSETQTTEVRFQDYVFLSSKGISQLNVEYFKGILTYPD